MDGRGLDYGGSYPLPSSPWNPCFKTHHRNYIQEVLKYFAIFIDNIAYIAKSWFQVPELNIITIGQMLSCFMWCWAVSLAFPFHSSRGKCVFLCTFLESYVILCSYPTEAIVKLQSWDTGDPDDQWFVCENLICLRQGILSIIQQNNIVRLMIECKSRCENPAVYCEPVMKEFSKWTKCYFVAKFSLGTRIIFHKKMIFMLIYNRFIIVTTETNDNLSKAFLFYFLYT